MLSRTIFRTASRQCVRAGARMYSTEAPPPPLLQKIRANLKTAMRAKDAPRLAVLRALLAQTLNASKTSSPILTDMNMLSLIRKNSAASKTAVEEFVAAGRQDLADKENEQLKVYEEYMAGVEIMGEEEVSKVVGEVVQAIEGAKKQGEVMKQVLAKMEGKNVDKGLVARVVKEVLAK